MGSEREPALTSESFKRRLLDLFEEHPEYGYAVIEVGPFQAHIGVFQRTRGQSHKAHDVEKGKLGTVEGCS